MCDRCFEKRYFRFDSEGQYSALNSELNKKLAQGDLKYLDNISNGYGSFGYNLYECQYCKRIWCMSDPDLHWRGFFLDKRATDKHVRDLNRGDRIKLMGCLLAFIIMTFLILLFIFY